MTFQIPPTVSIAEQMVVIPVENIKCGGCANSIKSALEAQGLVQVSVDHQNSTVRFLNPQSDESVRRAIDGLQSLGYPVVATQDGFKALALKARSFVSCALGKIS